MTRSARNNSHSGERRRDAARHCGPAQAGRPASRATSVVIAGLVLGKVIGISGGAWLATRFTRAELSPTVRWIGLVGMSQLAGVVFTVSLLITELSYPGDPALTEIAKTAVLVASTIATLTASVTLGLRSAHYRALNR